MTLATLHQRTGVAVSQAIPAMSDDAIAKVRSLEAKLRALPQVPVATDHVLHAGMYARTIRIPAGVVLTGALIQIATLLIANGDCQVFVGDDVRELHGYNVLPASAHRRQAFIAITDTDLTMIFTTRSQTVSDAEEEFTDEAHLLMSRDASAINTVRITGE